MLVGWTVGEMAEQTVEQLDVMRVDRKVVGLVAQLVVLTVVK